MFLVAVIAAGALALPETSGAQMPSGDSVTANATLYLDETAAPDLVVGSLRVDARSGPSGENPSGTVGFHFGGGAGPDTFGTVTCLAVNGTKAAVGFEGTLVDGLTGETFPVAYVLQFIDGGPSASGPPWPDTFVDDIRLAPEECALAPTGPSLFSYAADGITVVDAPPLPTSKDQCKNGGWRNFADAFKNQGQCVAFVERGPKP
jgi:hypothetical protein